MSRTRRRQVGFAVAAPRSMTFAATLVLVFALVLGLVGAAMARPPQSSLRPVARGQVVNGQVVSGQAAGNRAVSGQSNAASVSQSPEVVGVTQTAKPKKRFVLFRSLRPNDRPKSVEDKARSKQAARARGAVCGDPDIQGLAIGPVPGKLNGCGVEQAVRVSSVSGVALSTHAVMDCTTAKSLKRWIETGMKPAVKRRGGGVAQIKVAAHYACRTRNNQPGAKISEHGRGRAIDISAFRLRDGSEITVLNGWQNRKDGKILRQMHGAACGPFGTVLGPNANRFHLDHFHFDTARYRSGTYCR